MTSIGLQCLQMLQKYCRVSNAMENITDEISIVQKKSDLGQGKPNKRGGKDTLSDCGKLHHRL
jgi:hypothetical protein